MVEHRAQQRTQLLRAVVELVAETPATPVTLAAIGERVGLARSSVYKYFPSVDDIILAAVEEIFARWTAEVEAAADSGAEPTDRIERFVSRTLALVAEGEHGLMVIAASMPLDPARRRRIGEQHRAFMRPLVEALTELRIRDAATSASLVYGIVEAATRLIETGKPADQVADLATSLVAAAVADLPRDEG